MRAALNRGSLTSVLRTGDYVLGEMRLTRAQRIRVIVLFIAFEAGMPLAGMALGSPLTHLTGSPAHVVVDPYQIGCGSCFATHFE
jgi:hypothetical protein